MPLKVELENALEDNFHNLVSISEINFENKLNRYIENAESLSSRTMIKNELDRYVEGEISLEEVRNYSQAKYADGAEALHHANSAYRISNDRIISYWGEEQIKVINNFDFSEEKDIEIKIGKNDEYVIIKSKIINASSNKIGDDFVVFDLQKILEEINSDDIKHTILRERPSSIHKQKENNKIVEYRKLLNTDYWLRAEMSTNLLYENIQSISTKIILSVAVAIVIIGLIIISSLKSTAEKVILNLEKEIKEKTRLSETDSMLGVYNRTKLMDVLAKEIERANRYGNDLSLIMFDIDKFKEINDTHGHQLGDEVLKKIVSIVENDIRKTDILARYGGDEFTLVCPETTLKEVKKLANRIKTSVRDYKCQEDIDLSCSFGVAQFRNNKENLDTFIKRADDALYKAKDQGRNRVCE
ncbi:MAG: GGDEF domain-containing protein [Halanaerobium sp.]